MTDSSRPGAGTQGPDQGPQPPPQHRRPLSAAASQAPARQGVSPSASSALRLSVNRAGPTRCSGTRRQGLLRAPPEAGRTPRALCPTASTRTRTRRPGPARPRPARCPRAPRFYGNGRAPEPGRGDEGKLGGGVLLLTGMVASSRARRTSRAGCSPTSPGSRETLITDCGNTSLALPRLRLLGQETQRACALRARPAQLRVSRAFGVLNYACAEAFRVYLLGRRTDTELAQYGLLLALRTWFAERRSYLADPG